MIVRLLASVAVVALLNVVASPVTATTVSQGLTPNVLNTIEDQDREAYIDANEDGTFNVGDVLIGFARIDNFLPAGLAAGNQVYAVISNQVLAINGNFVSVGAVDPVANPGLTLSALTGDAINADALFAIYDTAGSFGDLVSAPVGVSMLDNITFIAGGNLQLSLGIVAADDFHTTELNALGSVILVGSNAPITGLSAALPIAGFTSGLSVLDNNTGFTFADAVPTFDALTGVQTNQVGIANGAVRGAAGDGNEAIFTNVPGFAQCQTDPANGTVPCGFVTDADFFIFPTAVPAPGALVLLGVGLAGIAGAGYLRRR
jgi:hypothetical protein